MVSLAIALVWFSRLYLVEPFRIPSPNMMPTLYEGDRIFVNKFRYGFLVPWTRKLIPLFSPPHRGDLVVFISPRDPSLHYIKRVVGLPGERISFRGHQIFIQGKQINSLKIDPNISLPRDFQKKVVFEEHLEGEEGTHHVLYSEATPSSLSLLDSQLEVTLPKDAFFVVGDNRDDSYDSRSWGAVPISKLRGKPECIWWSMETALGAQGSLWSQIRWHRIASWIH